MSSHEKKMSPWLLTVSSRWAHGKFTVSSRWPKLSQPALTGPWLSCDLAVTEPWLSCDLAATELWPSRDLAVTSLWLSLVVTEPWSLGPGAVITVFTVSSRWAHGDHLFSHGLTGHGVGRSCALQMSASPLADAVSKYKITHVFFHPSLIIMMI